MIGLNRCDKNMRDVWLNPAHTAKWDSDPLSQNPLRSEQLDLLLTLILDHYANGSTILDIGSGTGLVEEELFHRLPKASIVGVDYSPAMLAKARERHAHRGDQFVMLQHDLNTLEQLQLPSRNYQIAFSVQTLHNLPALSQRKVIAWVYSVLSEKGFFFLLDRIAIPSEDLFPVYQSFWNRQGRLYSTEISEAASFAAYQQHLEANGDLPLALEENLGALAESGFHVTALDVHGNRALMACIKKT